MYLIICIIGQKLYNNLWEYRNSSSLKRLLAAMAHFRESVPLLAFLQRLMCLHVPIDGERSMQLWASQKEKLVSQHCQQKQDWHVKMLLQEPLRGLHERNVTIDYIHIIIILFLLKRPSLANAIHHTFINRQQRNRGAGTNSLPLINAVSSHCLCSDKYLKVADLPAPHSSTECANEPWPCQFLMSSGTPKFIKSTPLIEKIL